jgi:hypothetical protein
VKSHYPSSEIALVSKQIYLIVVFFLHPASCSSDEREEDNDYAESSDSPVPVPDEHHGEQTVQESMAQEKSVQEKASFRRLKFKIGLIINP